MGRSPALPRRPGGALLSAAALAGLAVLYALNVGRFFTGHFNDDARHVLAARALLAGHFDDLTLPFRSPATNLLPGYPLLLAPALVLGGERAGQWLSALFSLLAAACAWRLPRGSLRASAVLFALHPTIAACSGTLLSEPAYLFWTLAALVWLEGLKAAHLPAFALWLVLAAWIRPHGFLLGVVLLPLALKRAPSRRSAWTVGLGAATLAALPYLRNLWLTGVPASYFDELGRSSGAAASLGQLWATVASNLAYYFWEVPATLAPGLRSVPGPLQALWSAAVWPALALGFRALWSGKEAERARPRLAYLVLYAGLSLAWVNRTERYLLPVLPFLYELALAALPSRRVVLAAAAALAALSAPWSAVQALRSLRRGGYARTGPAKSYAWVRAHTAPEDVVLAPFRQSFHLNTGRKTIDYFHYEDPDDFFEYLLRNKVRWAVIDGRHTHVGMVPSRAGLVEARDRVVVERIEDPSRFRLAYSDGEDRMAVFQVLPAPGFLEARARLPGILGAAGKGRYEEALRGLRSLEQEKAPLKRLDFLIGTTALLAGRSAEACSYLERARRVEPRFETARRNRWQACGTGSK